MKKYKIIYADPAWSYDDKCLHRGGAERHYRTMNIEDIKNLPVNEIAEDDCILFMWATFPKLQEALDVINAWGFQYKTNAFTWVKKNKKADSLFWGMGRWTRSNAEICLLAVITHTVQFRAHKHISIKLGGRGEVVVSQKQSYLEEKQRGDNAIKQDLFGHAALALCVHCPNGNGSRTEKQYEKKNDDASDFVVISNKNYETVRGNSAKEKST